MLLYMSKNTFYIGIAAVFIIKKPSGFVGYFFAEIILTIPCI